MDLKRLLDAQARDADCPQSIARRMAEAGAVTLARAGITSVPADQRNPAHPKT